jgi:phosphoribosylaminoimidazole-succinocarboxamide synthase
MLKNQQLAANVITPTTKSEDHDVPISPQEIVAQVGPLAMWAHMPARVQRVCSACAACPQLWHRWAISDGHW